MNKLYIVIVVILALAGAACVHSEEAVVFTRFSECPDSPNCVSSLADPSDEEHFIVPYTISGDIIDIYRKLIDYLETQPNVKIEELESETYIHAVYTSSFFKFKDDVEFLFSESAEGLITVDICSRSRTGYSDLGVNRKRMETLRLVLESE